MSLLKNFGKWFNQKFCSTKEKRTKIANIMKKLSIEPKLIVYMDGGLCSQINQFAIGEYYKDKGYRVEYDLTFFEKNGKDLNGIFDRNFQLDQFLNIDKKLIIESNKSFSNYLYKRLFFNAVNIKPNPIVTWVSDEFCVPIYLNNYYCFKSEEMQSIFKKFIHLRNPEEILDEENQKIAKRISESDCVGIHVRLGDLAKLVDCYNTVSEDYYLRAIHLPELKGKELYFFSEEPEWIEKNILPKLDNCIKTNIIKNPSNEGYKDLLLLSLCKHQVCSQGSFGPYSYIFNNNPDKICVFPDFPKMKNWECVYDWDIVFKDNHIIKIKP